MAQQWRRLFCAVVVGCLGKRATTRSRVIALFPMAQQWRKKRRRALRFAPRGQRSFPALRQPRTDAAHAILRIKAPGPARLPSMSTSAIRMRALRRRRRQGLAQFKIEIDENALAEAFIASQRLLPEETQRQALLEREIGRLVGDYVERWLVKKV
jgi:hypothetical protein